MFIPIRIGPKNIWPNPGKVSVKGTFYVEKWIFSIISGYILCIFSLDVSIGPFSVLSKSGFEINKTCFMKKDI